MAQTFHLVGGKRPPTGEEIDLEHRHHRMREIAARIQDGANRSFPNDLSSRYRYDKVYALLICWADEDPRLPVSIELNDLSRLFSDEFGFQAETWQIPTDNCHNELSHKVLDFIGIGDDNRNDLKIVYYGGHGILTKGRQLAWTKYKISPSSLFIPSKTSQYSKQSGKDVQIS